MRNRKDEREKQLQVIFDLISNIESQALKTKRNYKHEILLKCAEVLEDYASDIVKEILND